MSDAGSPPRQRTRLNPPAVDLALVERLNAWWRLSGPESGPTSWRQRLALPVRRALARFLGPQETFNSAVVQFANATTTAQAVAIEQIDAALTDTIDRCQSAVDATFDEARRYREALGAKERRIEAGIAALRTEFDELRTAVGVLQNQIRSQRSTRADAAERWQPGAPGSPQGAAPDVPAGASSPNATLALSEKYVGFEDQFRGTPEQIRSRLLDYLPLFDGAADVLDIGCGRGEFLRLLRERGVSARGIDLNGAMVDVCRASGLDATQADALSYLQAQPDASLGGLFAAQVVEHLEPAYLTHLLDAAFDKLRPGAAIVLETINPACWFAFFESYIRDITHVRPLHPDTLKFLLIATGFQQIDIEYRAPYPEHEKLQRVASTAAPADAVEALNANVDKLNSLLFTYLDYAAVARRP